MSERLPSPDTTSFPPLEDRHLRNLPAGTLLGRIHQQAGPHPLAWNEFRAYGPTRSRFDHQPPPARAHPSRAVLYAAPALPALRRDTAPPLLRTCLAEVFRDRGVVDVRSGEPFFVLMRVARPLALLDVADSDWITRAGGNAAISSGRRFVAREWSRAVYRHYTGPQALEGILYTCSNVPSARSVFLYERARTALPPRPELHLPLTHPSLRADLEVFCVELGLELLA